MAAPPRLREAWEAAWEAGAAAHPPRREAWEAAVELRPEAPWDGAGREEALRSRADAAVGLPGSERLIPAAASAAAVGWQESARALEHGTEAGRPRTFLRMRRVGAEAFRSADTEPGRDCSEARRSDRGRVLP